MPNGNHYASCFKAFAAGAKPYDLDDEAQTWLDDWINGWLAGTNIRRPGAKPGEYWDKPAQSGKPETWGQHFLVHFNSVGRRAKEHMQSFRDGGAGGNQKITEQAVFSAAQGELAASSCQLCPSEP